MAKSSGTRGQYQRVMPITNKNVGKNLHKSGMGAGPRNAKKEG